MTTTDDKLIFTSKENIFMTNFLDEFTTDINGINFRLQPTPIVGV